MRMLSCLLTLLFAVVMATAAPPAPPNALDIYFIDVEGGQATLFVTPDRQSLLIDTGWPGRGGRDADRIVEAAHRAGLTRIDNVLITHFHQDHVGGVPQLVARIPVGTLIDHGVNREETEPDTHAVYAEYRKVLTSPQAPRHVIAQLGQTFTLGALAAQVVSVDGQLLAHPLASAGAANAACARTETRPADQTENARSLGLVLTYGKVKIVDLGDLTWDKEQGLMCPANLLGHAEVYIVSHHGWEQSGSPALVHGLQPRIAIMDNGATKGGSPSAWRTIEQSSGLEDLWQLHFAESPGAENVAPTKIANLKRGPDGNWLKLSISANGSMSVYNSRTGLSTTYPAR